MGCCNSYCTCYLDGVRDGFRLGVKVGYEIGHRDGYEDGIHDGVKIGVKIAQKIAGCEDVPLRLLPPVQLPPMLSNAGARQPDTLRLKRRCASTFCEEVGFCICLNV